MMDKTTAAKLVLGGFKEDIVNVAQKELKFNIADVVTVPENFPHDRVLSMGQQAEKTVFDTIKHSKIPGAKIVFFNDTRVIGSRNYLEEDVIREADFQVHVTYDGRMYLFMFEVKCIHDTERRIHNMRKKAETQLRDMKSIIGRKLQVNTDQIHCHALWPNMDTKYKVACTKCGKHHVVFQDIPQACQDRHNQYPAYNEDKNFHLLKDKFQGDAFTSWLLQVISDPTKAVEQNTYDKVLSFFTLLSCGVLYDKLSEKFCVLGKDQKKLVDSALLPIDTLRGVMGLAGTGKTIAVCARVEQHKIKRRLGPQSKVAYICESETVQNWVRMVLSKCGVDVTSLVKFISLKNDASGNPFDFHKEVKELVNDGFRFIYIDSAEDLGVKHLNKLITSMVQPRTSVPSAELGDVWILFDQYQSLIDGHVLLKNSNTKQVCWGGVTLDEESIKAAKNGGQIFTLTTSFRMPENVLEHIKKSCLLPEEKFPVAVFEGAGTVKVKTVAGLLVEEIAEEVHDIVCKRGIHPGHIAVVFEKKYAQMLFNAFNNDKAKFVEALEISIQKKMHKEKKLTLHGTGSPNESFHFGLMAISTDPGSSVAKTEAMSVSNMSLLFQTDRHTEV